MTITAEQSAPWRRYVWQIIRTIQAARWKHLLSSLLCTKKEHPSPSHTYTHTHTHTHTHAHTHIHKGIHIKSYTRRNLKTATPPPPTHTHTRPSLPSKQTSSERHLIKHSFSNMLACCQSRQARRLHHMLASDLQQNKLHSTDACVPSTKVTE